MIGDRHSFTVEDRRGPLASSGSYQLLDLKKSPEWSLSVEKSLAFLPDLYPGGDRWLKKRLVDINEERARCLLAVTPTKLLGVAIQTPKQFGVVKLSTFYIERGHRAKGVGATMLTVLTAAWRSENVRKAYVTVASTKVAELEPLLRRFGFECVKVHNGRYGISRDEFIYEWIQRRR